MHLPKASGQESIFDDPDMATTPAGPKMPAPLPELLAPRPPGPAVAPPVQPTPPAVQPVTPRRARDPVPEAADIAAAERNLKDVFKADYEKRNPADKVALAKLLVQRAQLGKDRGPTLYVMLREARDLAAGAGAADTATDAARYLARAFLVDPFDSRFDALTKLTRSATTPESREAVAQACLTALDDARAAGKYEAAVKLAGVADTAAGKSSPAAASQLKRRAADARALKVEYDKARSAAEKLRRNPADVDSAAAIGLFLCLVHGDWPAGLPWLTLSPRAELQTVANAELKPPTASGLQATLADGWVEAARGLAGAVRAGAEERAAYWYKQALARAPEDDRPAIRKKLESLPGQVPFTKIASMTYRSDQLDRSRMISGRDGTPFSDLPREGALLTGIVATTAGGLGRPYVASVQPIYLTADGRKTGETHGTPGDDETTIEAKEGYAVGGIVGKGNSRVDGFKVVFMRIRGATLDAGDMYESAWVGGRSNHPDTPLGGDGKLAIGLHGAKGRTGELDGVGLIRMK